MDPEQIVIQVAVWLTVGLGGLFLLLPKFTASLVGFGKVNSPFTGFRTFGGMMAALGGYSLYDINSASTLTVLAIAWGGAGVANLFALMLEDDDATRMALLRLFVALAIGGSLYYVVN